MKKILLIAPLYGVLVGCGAGSGEGLDNQGLPLDSNPNNNPGNEQPGSVTLTTLQTNIFGAICSRCHTGASAPHGLRLDSEENSYAFLVGHVSEEMPDMLRVKPGKPDESYMVKKIEGDPSIVGNRMPLGGPYLSQEQIASIRDWITNGAPRSGTGSLGTGISQVITESVDEKFNANIRFSRPVQFQTIANDSIQVAYKMPSAPPVKIDTFFGALADNSLEIRLQDIPPEATAIEITIKDSEMQPILDNQGKAIDGDADGVDGGSYHYVYQR